MEGLKTSALTIDIKFQPRRISFKVEVPTINYNIGHVGISIPLNNAITNYLAAVKTFHNIYYTRFQCDFRHFCDMKFCLEAKRVDKNTVPITYIRYDIVMR